MIFFFYRHTKEHSTKIVAMEKENTFGQMDQNSRGHFSWTERKDMENLFLPMVVNLRSV